jgi:hypothetical protein
MTTNDVTTQTEYDRLKQQLQCANEDSCADDAEIRRLVKAACPSVDVAGNAEGVPTVVDVVEQALKHTKLCQSVDGSPAFPVPNDANVNDQAGMSLRAYAAIKLRVPDSGTDWLDTMIRQAQRDELAGQIIGHLAVVQNTESLSEDVASAYRITDAMLARRAK